MAITESPMKIEAGGRLKLKKETRDPIRTTIKSINSILPISCANHYRVINIINEIPEAHPSRPSMRLRALMIPTIHKMVRGIDQNSRSNFWKNGPSILSIVKPK